MSDEYMTDDEGLQLEPGWFEKTLARATADVDSWSDDKYEMVCSMFPELRNRRRTPHKRADGWISTRERLPEVGDTVLVWCGDVYKATLTYDYSDSSTRGERWLEDGDTETRAVDFYSHWMPKPRGPVPS